MDLPEILPKAEICGADFVFVLAHLTRLVWLDCQDTLYPEGGVADLSCSLAWNVEKEIGQKIRENERTFKKFTFRQK